jgi:hypothetical protein
MSNKITIASGVMDYNFFETFLEPHNKKTANLLKQYWTDREDCVYYKVVGIKNQRDLDTTEYSECWFIESQVDWLPFVVTEINTSSPYAMCRCGMDRDEDENEEPETYDTIEDIVVQYCDKYLKRELLEYLNHLKYTTQIITSPLNREEEEEEEEWVEEPYVPTKKDEHELFHLSIKAEIDALMDRINALKLKLKLRM